MLADDVRDELLSAVAYVEQRDMRGRVDRVRSRKSHVSEGNVKVEWVHITQSGKRCQSICRVRSRNIYNQQTSAANPPRDLSPSDLKTHQNISTNT